VNRFTMPQGVAIGTLAAMTQKQFKGLADWIEVFQAGTHVDSLGKKSTFTTGDLDEMVANHQLGAAPAVLGHPEHNHPAYAWVSEYQRKGKSLFAKFEKINAAFAAGVEAGAYLNRSVSVFKDKAHGWRVRHVGWLGAAAPAIDGLQPVEFAAPDADCSEFSAPGYSLVWGLESAATLLRRLRDRLIADSGLEVADDTLPQYQLDSMQTAAQQARDEFQAERAAPQPAFSQPPQPTGVTMPFTQADLDRTAAETEARVRAEAQAQSQAQTQTQTAHFAAQTAELERLRTERHVEQINVQLDALTAAGRLLPAERPGMAEFMAGLDAADTAQFNFTAADKSVVKKTPSAFFADFLAARPALIKLGSQAAAGRDAPIDTQSADALADAAKSFIKAQADKGITVSISEAIGHVSK
jgi:hypothetical protein